MTGAPDVESPAGRYDRLALPFVRAHTPLLLAGVVVPAGGRVLDHGAGTGEGAGTPVYAVKGWSPSCRLAAQRDGSWHVYLASEEQSATARPKPCALTPSN